MINKLLAKTIEKENKIRESILGIEQHMRMRASSGAQVALSVMKYI